VHVAYAVDHLGSGGAQRQVVELARELASRRDMTVSLLTYHEQDFFRDRLTGTRVEQVRFEKRRKIDPTLPRQIARWLADRSPDLLHAFLVHPAVWYRMGVRLLPRSQRPHFVAAERDNGIGRTRLDPIERALLYRSSDAVTVNSRAAAETLERRLRVPPERIHYVPNGIDLEAWDREARAACPLALEPGCFHLAHVGRLEPQKNHALLLEALSRSGPDALRNWRVWFVGAETGEAGYPRRIRSQVARLGLEKVVRFEPATRRIAALLKGIDALVLPSQHEGFPNVLLEAMAAGIPSVATRVGEAETLIDPGRTGFLVPPDDADELARALGALGRLPLEDRDEMGKRARTVVESRYRIADVADLNLAVYQSLV
jgi:glycosyltransferase involved in cell wall biosynthesis